MITLDSRHAAEALHHRTVALGPTIRPIAHA